MSVRNYGHRKGFSFPTFVWEFGIDDPKKRVGKIEVWPLGQGTAVLDIRWRQEFSVTEADKILKEIGLYGWGKPPHFEKVFGSVRKLLKRKDIRIFEKLGENWKKLISQATG